MPDVPFVDSLGAAHVNDQIDGQAGQIEALVEAVGKGAKVALGVLGVAEGLVGARQHGLEVAQDGVDPLELRQVPGLTLTDHFSAVGATGVGDGGEAGQTVAEDRAARLQVGLRPGRDRFVGKRRHRAELHMQRVACFVEGDGCNQGHLVLRASARLAAGALAAQVGIIDLHRTRQAALRLPAGHRRHDLVMHQPSRRVAHADVALEFERRQPGLGLADQVDPEEPTRQRQLRVVQQRAGGQRGLSMTSMTLVEAAAVAHNATVRPAAAAWADEAIGPARTPQGFGTGRFGAKALEEFRQGHALLELDRVVGHGWESSVTGLQRRGRVAHQMSQA
jgi:hypothetical protein